MPDHQADEQVPSDGPRARQPEPWRARRMLGRADVGASLLAAAAIFLSALPLYRGPDASGRGLFIALAPLSGAAIFVVLIYMFAERSRHGWARLLLCCIGVALAVSAAAFTTFGHAPIGRVLLSYWLPAILCVAAAAVLERGHHRARALEARWSVPPRRW